MKKASGRKHGFVPGICWFTNFDINKRHEKLLLWKKYVPEEYPRYVNYDAIECGKVSDIPVDYDGAMGVPITFLDKYNPEQFEIAGISRDLAGQMSDIAEKGTYEQGGPRFYLENDKSDRLKYKRLYDRIVIKMR